ncbi:hypothetical protein B0I33_101650 [Prauserella shujinwangii]|uniref:Excreted virulence factor EspC (Type VII ESX diderm) n=1 Tax=Prauserella shujinwangii TaxID=1453103 RepID=A0A2T0M448_9PSEU|nr:hypothetical protein [Prauserella shujinwangii]PRX51496.1 hypothetical protein B0I33_101650 [Prauserella shujinwangii]
MSTPHGHALGEARRLVEDTTCEIAAEPVAPAALHAAVEHLYELVGALAELLGTVAGLLPATLAERDGDGRVIPETCADLDSARRCLANGALLLEPARDDLRRLTRPVGPPASGLRRGRDDRAGTGHGR